MNMKKTLLASSVALATLTLVACGGGGDSQDSGASSATSFTGLVIDGRIAGGTVWVDANENGQIDSFEPTAVTDSQGYYTYNPEKQINYCADASKSELYQHCLKTSAVSTEAYIKIAGGLDLDTLEVFKGVMTLKTSVSDAKAAEQNIVNNAQKKDTTSSVSNDLFEQYFAVLSPLTSLLSTIDSTNYATVLGKLGVTDTSTIDKLLKKDFSLSSGMSDTATTELLKASYKVQKFVDAISINLDEQIKKQSTSTGVKLGENSITSSSEFVKQELAKILQETAVTSFDNINSTNIATVVDNAATSVATKLATSSDAKQNAAAIKTSIAPANVQTQVTTATNTVKTTLQSKLASANTTATLKTAVLAAQVVVTSVKKAAETLATNQNNTTINTTISKVADVITDANFDTNFTTALSTGTFEVSTFTTTLEKATESGTFNASTYVTTTLNTDVGNSTLATSVTVNDPSIWATKYLSMSGISDKGDSSKEEKGRVIFFFQADSASATSGRMAACVAFNSVGTADDVEAELFTGGWQESGSRSVITINADAGVSFLVKAFKQEAITDGSDEAKQFLGVGTLGVYGSDKYGKFRFDYDGNTYTWFSDVALPASPTAADWGMSSIGNTFPATKADCLTAAGGLLKTNVF